MSDVNPDLNETETDDDAVIAAMWDDFDEVEGLTPANQDDAATADGFTIDTDPVEEAADPVAVEAETGAIEGDPVEDTPITPEAPATPSAWEGAPPELRAEYEKLAAEKVRLEHEVRSHKGRAVGAQRRYDELVKAAQPRNAGSGDRPTPQAALAAIKEDYPDIAGPLEKAFGAIQGDVETLNTAEEGRRQAAETELNDYVNGQTEALNALHPGYVDLFKANGEKLLAWVEDQPKADRDAFWRNAEHIVDASEAAKVIGAFKTFIGITPAASAAEASPAAKPSLDARRQRQLESTANPNRSSRRPASSGIPEDGDPEAIWAAFDALEAR